MKRKKIVYYKLLYTISRRGRSLDWTQHFVLFGFDSTIEQIGIQVD